MSINNNSAHQRAFELMTRLRLLKDENVDYINISNKKIKEILLMFIKEAKDMKNDNYINDLYFDHMKDFVEGQIPNFIEGTQVNNDGFNIVGDKGKEVIINHKGKTHKIWKNHLDYIERTKHLNTIDEPTKPKQKKD